MRTVAEPGKQTDLIGLHVAELADGEQLDYASQDETCVVVLTGTVDAAAGGAPLGRAGGRASVFEGPGHAIYLAPDEPLRLTATGGPAELAIATAPLAGEPAAQSRVITPADQRTASPGSGNWARSVRTILGPEHEAGRLLLGETINPPGNWSSYPPHKHDTHRPPREVQLEEVYLFKVDPPEGFGVQVRYGDGDSWEETSIIRDGSSAAIRSGYHPVVAAPGYTLYYLWVMAGQGRQMIPFLDPRYAWVQQGR
ncbi:MAG TPA: 5-deoxy-glucuronate isomerase [Streptosporangiaceae bacterium]|nr:5-deoxy-glucuronate isomerase [Streptosporangiaceae bacterium]